MRRLLLLGLAAAACATDGSRLTPTFTAPGAHAALRAAHRVVVLVDTSAQTALGGVPIKSPERALELKAQVLAATRDLLARRGLEAVPADGDADAREAQLLFDRVVWSAVELEPPEDVVHPFAYGIGSVDPLVEAARADHLVVVSSALTARSFGEFGTSGAVLNIALGLCDRQGRVLWLRSGGHLVDEREPQLRAVKRLVGALLAEFPGEP